MHNAIRRELRVAFSKKAQPPLFRVIKWVVFMAGTALISRTGFFRYWVIGLPLLSIMAHFVYRWKTRGWTRPWGGWSDLEAGQELLWAIMVQGRQRACRGPQGSKWNELALSATKINNSPDDDPNQ